MQQLSLYLLLGLSLCMACSRPDASRSEKTASETETYETGRDYFPDKATFGHAKQVTVEYHNHYKVVKTSSVLESWSGGESRQQHDVMVLVQKGTPVPDLTGPLAGAAVIRIPVESVALNVASAEAFMERLGLTQHIVAVGGVGSYQDSLREGALSGRLGQVGYSWHQPPQMEVLLARKPEVFFMQLSNLDYQQHLGRCRELGIPTATVFEWAEAHYLGRAEWLKYFALFFNQEAKANQLFAEVAQTVDSIQQLTQRLTARPSVIWGYYAGKERWWLNSYNFEAQLLQDAGLNNLFAAGEGHTVEEGQEPVASETLLQRGRNADHWIIGDIHSAALPPEHFMQSFKAWQENRLYHNMKRSKMAVNAYDWYGSAVVRPDLVLADLVALTHPDLLPRHQLYYMDTFDKQTPLPLPNRNL